jgi:hypothetical protein
MSRRRRGCTVAIPSPWKCRPRRRPGRTRASPRHGARHLDREAARVADRPPEGCTGDLRRPMARTRRRAAGRSEAQTWQCTGHIETDLAQDRKHPVTRFDRRSVCTRIDVRGPAEHRSPDLILTMESDTPPVLCAPACERPIPALLARCTAPARPPRSISSGRLRTLMDACDLRLCNGCVTRPSRLDRSIVVDRSSRTDGVSSYGRECCLDHVVGP